MSLSDRELDKKIQEYLSKKEIVLPESYTYMIKDQLRRCCEQSEKRQVDEVRFVKYRKKIRIRMAAIFAVVCVVFGGSIGVHATINYIQKRMNGLSQEERNTFVEQVVLAEADSFSREFTEKEKERINTLVEKYKDGLFPKYELLQIFSEDDIVSDRICFVTESSIFYLPEETIDDEQLLELIDFYFKRDYSIMSQNVVTEYQQVDELSQEDAEYRAALALKRVFGISTDYMEISTEYVQATDTDGDAFSVNYIKFIDESSGEQYMVTVNLQTGCISELSFEKTDENNYSKMQKESPEFYRELLPDAEKIALGYFAEDNTWSKIQIEYVVNEDNFLDSGIVNYVFQNDGKEYCIVSYSCLRECFYQIRYFTNEEKANRDLQIEEQIELRQLERRIMEMR